MTGDEYCDELERLAEARSNAIGPEEVEWIEREMAELERTYWSSDNLWWKEAE